MLRFLNDSEPEMRQASIEVITKLAISNVDTILTKLTPLLADSNPKIREAILQALANVADIPREIIEQIRQCFSDSNIDVKSAALSLLTRLRDQETLLPALQILSNQEYEPSLRSQAATTLGELGDMEALTILTWAIKDNTQSVRLAALNALMRLEKRQICNSEIDSKKTRTPLDVIIATLNGEIIKPTVESPLEASQISPNAEIPESPPNYSEEKDSISTLEAIQRNNAASLINEQNPNDAIELLQDSENISVDIQEYMTIAQKNIQLGERLFTPQKLDIAADVRYLSARILADSDKAVNALVTVLNGTDLGLRREAAASLGIIAQRSPQELENAFADLVLQLSNEDTDVQLACIRILGYLSNQAVIGTLLPYLHAEDAWIRTQTIQALTEFISAKSCGNDTDIIIAKFIEMLQDNSVNVCKAAANALAKLQCSEAIDEIIEAVFISEGRIAQDIGRALKSLDIELSITKLLQKLEEFQNSNYQRLGLEMLEEMVS